MRAPNHDNSEDGYGDSERSMHRYLLVARYLPILVLLWMVLLTLEMTILGRTIPYVSVVVLLIAVVEIAIYLFVPHLSARQRIFLRITEWYALPITVFLAIYVASHYSEAGRAGLDGDIGIGPIPIALSSIPRPSATDLVRRQIGNARAQASGPSGPVFIPLPADRQFNVLYRAAVGVPADYLPEAESLIIADVGVVTVNTSSRTMTVGQTEMVTATVVFDQSRISNTGNQMLELKTNNGNRYVPDVMRASLVQHTSAFTETPRTDSSDYKIIDIHSPQSWNWAILPQRKGDDRVSVSVYASASILPNSPPKEIVIASTARPVRIEVDEWIVYRILKNSFFQNIVLTSIASTSVGAAIVYILQSLIKSRRGSQSADSTILLPR